jgi:hypothetical protein
MRSFLVLGVLMGILGGARPTLAQSYPMRATIAVSKVEVRSGPSDKYYATADLHQGDSVTVIGPVKDQPGWLEIKPPWGSFTWVNAKDVKQIDAYEAVVPKDCQALVGSALNTNKPDVQTKAGFLAGSIVYIVKQPVTDPGGETFLPVQPDLREVRYIPANAITAPTTATVSAPPAWNKASPAQPTALPGHPGTTDIKPASTSLSSPATAAPATNYPAEWSSYGILRTTTFQKDGQPMYVLVTQQGQPILYVTSRAGTSLAGFVNRTVSLYGPRVYRPDDYIRTPWMVASHVAVP